MNWSMQLSTFLTRSSREMSTPPLTTTVLILIISGPQSLMMLREVFRPARMCVSYLLFIKFVA